MKLSTILAFSTLSGVAMAQTALRDGAGARPQAAENAGDGRIPVSAQAIREGVVDPTGTGRDAQPPASASTPQPPAGDQTQSGDIVVTATRRSQSVQNIPLSITALSSDTLEKRAATSFFDYGSSVPNLSFGNVAEGVSTSRSVAIRGIADRDTTGFYIDDTPLPDSIDPRIVDIARIEVLRGPQGTLYGARSEGGTVRLITEQPSLGGFSARLHQSLSTTRNTDRPSFQLDGAVNIPLGDTLALRAVGLEQYDAGFMKRFVTSTGRMIDNVGRSETRGGSAALLWKPAPNLSITPRFLYQATSYNGFPFSSIAVPAVPTSPVTLRPTSLTFSQPFDIAESSRDRWWLATFDAKLDLPFGALSSDSSYFRRRSRDIGDQSAAIADLLGYSPALPTSIEIGNDTDSFTEELRFASTFGGPFQLVAGLYYNRSTTKHFFPPNYIDGIDAAVGGAFGTDLLYFSRQRAVQTEYAAYAEGTLDITSRLRLIGGLRGFKVRTDASTEQDGIAAGGPSVFPQSSQRESGVTPRASLQYRFSPGNQVYFTAGKGFRPGGVNAGVPTAFGCAANLASLGVALADTQAYRSDSVWSYEVGAKTTFANRKITANVTGFRIDWSDIQQRIQLQCGFAFRGNAGSARSQGVELEVNARPLEGLSLNLGFGYTDAKFRETASGTRFRSGDRVPQVPRYTLNTGADYETSIGDRRKAFGHVDVAYVSDSTSAVNPATDATGRLLPRIRPSYTIVNSRIGVRFGELEFALFGKNLFDERANLSDTLAISVEDIGTARVTVNQPRTIGIEARQRF